MSRVLKQRILIFLGLAGILTVLIAASLSQLELQPGLPSPGLVQDRLVAPPTGELPGVQLQLNAFVVGLVCLFLVVFLVHLVYQFIQEVDRKKVFYQFLMYAAVLLVTLGLVALLLNSLPAQRVVIERPPTPTPEPIITAPLGSPPPVLFWLAAILLAIPFILLAGWFVRPRPRPVDGTSLLAQEAEKARQALLAGVGLRDVILRCYLQMSLALQLEQKIEREASMTTGEFERLLEAKGFPHQPVHQLTRLFDAARYSRWQPGPADDQNAIDCLEAIIQHSRKGKGSG